MEIRGQRLALHHVGSVFKLISSGLAASAFTNWAISLATLAPECILTSIFRRRHWGLEKFKVFKFFYHIHLFCLCLGTHAPRSARRSEDSLQECGLVLSFHSMGLGGWTQVIQLGGKSINPLRRIASPEDQRNKEDVSEIPQLVSGRTNNSVSQAGLKEGTGSG